MKHFKNTSRYSSDVEILPMLHWVTDWLELKDVDRIAFNIKNVGGKAAYRGRAYLGGPPAQSPWNKVKGVTGLCIVAIGHPNNFPVENLVNYRRKRIITDWIDGSPMPDESTTIQTKDGPITLQPRWRKDFPDTLKWEWSKEDKFRLYHLKVERLPYGGKTSRYYKCFDWREGFIAVAAHEVQHFKQREGNKRYSEVECEQVAGMVLDDYRRTIGTLVTPDGKSLIKRGVFSAALMGWKGTKGIQVPTPPNGRSQGATARLRASQRKEEKKQNDG